MDELALATNTDPVAFRLQYLKHPRDLAVVKAVAEKAGKGVMVIGVCNGFQILVEAGLLPAPRHIGTLEDGTHQHARIGAIVALALDDRSQRRMIGIEAGLEMAQEILLHAHSRYAGVYLMPSFGRYELCASVLDVLPGYGNVAESAPTGAS